MEQITEGNTLKRFIEGKSNSLLTIMLCLLMISTSCKKSDGHTDNDDRWSHPEEWFANSMSPEAGKVDVFYLVSTNVVTAIDSDGHESMRSLLTDIDKQYIDAELQWVKDSMFQTDFNFVAPYYHQYTFNAILQHEGKLDSLGTAVGQEVYAAFDYYMKHINNGRRFILAGFSQGGDMVMQILRRMPPEQYSRMVAAYVMGWKVTAQDTINYSTIRPASDEGGTGVTICFNSVLDTSAIWNIVAEGAAACINPINWKTDTTPAVFLFEGRTHEVSVEKSYNVLLVKTDPEPYRRWMRETYPYSISDISPDCLHHWDILFYRQQIHDNALTRSK